MTKRFHGETTTVADGNGAVRENEESGPHVGLFYVIDGQVYWEGVPVTRADGTPYFKSYPKTHAQYWKETLLKRIPSLNGYDSSSFPRGRVVLDKTNDTYEVISDTCIIENPAVVERIVSEMGLPAGKVKTALDTNCECPACRTAREREICAPKDPIEEQFKHTKDGRKVFFPWGPFGAGYLISSRRELKKLKKQAVVAHAISMSLVLGTIRLIVDNMTGLTIVWMSVLAFVLYLIGFQIWARYQCSGMTRIDRETVAR